MARPALTQVWMEIPVQESVQRLLDGKALIVHAAAPPAPAWTSGLEAQAALAASGVQYNGALFDAWPNLKVVARMGIGIDNVNVPEASERGVLVINTPDGPTESTAEHAIALLLSVAKRVKQGNANLAEGNFGGRTLLGTEVQGKTIAVIGLGRIGRRVAEICRLAFQMRVLGYDPMVSIEQAAAMGVEYCSVDEMLPQSEFVTVHTPSIPATRHLINSRTLGLMKQGAFLINVSRGPLVCEADLLGALEAGRLGGVGLDVFEQEPTAVDNPLRNHPLVVATPHMASYTNEGRERMERMAVERVLAFFAGQRPLDLCNPDLFDRIYA